jgi:hypothetical protein
MGKDDHGQEVTRSENKSLSILYYIIKENITNFTKVYKLHDKECN